MEGRRCGGKRREEEGEGRTKRKTERKGSEAGRREEVKRGTNGEEEMEGGKWSENGGGEGSDGGRERRIAGK